MKQTLSLRTTALLILIQLPSISKPKTPETSLETTLFGPYVSCNYFIQTKAGPIDTKPWTIVIYIAADNDLRIFAANNIKQMLEIGSNQYIHVFVHLDVKVEHNKKVTRWYYIEKNKLTIMNSEDPSSKPMDSGNPSSLVSAVQCAATHYPADNFAIVLWNHATGILDPNVGRIINPTHLFRFNFLTNKLEIDRSIGYLDFLEREDQRGICWDTSTGNYLTNEKQQQAFEKICKILNGKVRIVGFDACLMSMLEVGSMYKKWADIMVGSQEVELGSGWNYEKVLEPFTHTCLTPQEFAAHIVAVYAKSYHNITSDYTQSAVSLSELSKLEREMEAVAQILLKCLAQQQRNTVKATIKATRNRQVITKFDEPSYIDLHHWLKNMLGNINKFQLKPGHEPLKQDLARHIHASLALIESLVFANCCGSNLKGARGLSIYFPEQRIHPSYGQTSFAKESSWLGFLHHYLQV